MDKFEFQDGIKSKSRVQEVGEVYTPQNIVIDMLNLDKVKEESYRIESKFLEPSCGNGNFLVEILRRKLYTVEKESTTPEEVELNVIKSICNIYGVDIMADNIKQSKDRMKGIIESFFLKCGVEQSRNITKTIQFVLDRNIILGNTLENTMTQPYSGRLVFEEWEFTGKEVQRKSFKADNMDIEMNCNYKKVNYDKLYTVKDKEEEDMVL